MIHLSYSNGMISTLFKNSLPYYTWYTFAKQIANGIGVKQVTLKKCVQEHGSKTSATTNQEYHQIVRKFFKECRRKLSFLVSVYEQSDMRKWIGDNNVVG